MNKHVCCKLMLERLHVQVRVRQSKSIVKLCGLLTCTEHQKCYVSHCSVYVYMQSCAEHISVHRVQREYRECRGSTQSAEGVQRTQTKQGTQTTQETHAQ